MNKGNYNKEIDFYNKLTDIGGLVDNDNFLDSIEYKRPNGNLLLGTLINLSEEGIKFEILSGYVKGNNFNSCTIKLSSNLNIDIYLPSNISAIYLEDNIIEFRIEKEKDEMRLQ